MTIEMIIEIGEKGLRTRESDEGTYSSSTSESDKSTKSSRTRESDEDT